MVLTWMLSDRVRLLVNHETKEALAVKIINLNRVAMDKASDAIRKEVGIRRHLYQNPTTPLN